MSKKSRPPLGASLNVYRIPYDGGSELPTKEIVGSKAYNLMRMARRGLPVPPGFVFGTDLCRDYLDRGAAAFSGLDEVLERELGRLGSVTGRRFGDPKRPLLVSVRSGAVVSMPGMMETVLNVGLTETTSRGLIRLTGNPRLAPDCQRRFIQQFAEVVDGVKATHFEEILDARLIELELAGANELDSQTLAELVKANREAFAELVGQPFPSSPLVQLKASVEAVVKSWMSERAQQYRKMNKIPESTGTASIVQQMVFGNAGPTSGSGVGFTRNPSDGSKALYVDFLANAQGEDVVAGRLNALGMEELERRMPEAHRQLTSISDELEQEFGDMQDFEFTVEEGRLYMLQARSGKRTPLAALRIATDLVKEGKITPKTALASIKGINLESIEAVELTPPAGRKPLATAIPASSGVAIGVAVFDPARIATYSQKGKPVLLMRERTETSDIRALAEAHALVTARGARTSHAAVVARQLGKVCLVGCQSLAIDESRGRYALGGVEIKEGDTLTVDGTTGAIFLGAIPVTHTKPTELVDIARGWSNMGA